MISRRQTLVLLGVDDVKEYLQYEKTRAVTPECSNRGSTMLTTTLSSQVEWVGVQSEHRLDSRRFENLTVPREIEG